MNKRKKKKKSILIYKSVNGIYFTISDAKAKVAQKPV